jgi:xanthine dehydrogenase accessory factor
MVVTAGAVDGTIGGGHLEYEAIDVARSLLAAGDERALRRFALGASLGQCCGGAVEMLFEPVRGAAPWLEGLARARRERAQCAVVSAVSGAPESGHLIVSASAAAGTLGSTAHDAALIALARDALSDGEASRLVALPGSAGAVFLDVVRPPDLGIVLFGAGHVGRALVNVFAGLPCDVTWVDSRDAIFPATVPGNVEAIATDTPESEVAAASAGTYFLVMTHSHALDEQLAEAILARTDFAYFGLIGSLSKRRQFERRLAARGMPRERFAAMTCPIGIDGITGKEPEVIAVAVAAELLLIRARRLAAVDEQRERRA